MHSWHNDSGPGKVMASLATRLATNSMPFASVTISGLMALVGSIPKWFTRSKETKQWVAPLSIKAVVASPATLTSISSYDSGVPMRESLPTLPRGSVALAGEMGPSFSVASAGGYLGCHTEDSSPSTGYTWGSIVSFPGA